MAKAILPVETTNKVLNLLASMPYSQVADLINEIREKVSIVNDEQSEVTPSDE